MKSILPVIYCVVLLMGFSATINAQSYDIKLLLKPGTRFSYDITLDSKLEHQSNPTGDVQQTSTLTIDHLVKTILPSGNYLIEANYKRFRLKHKIGNRITTYHSDTIDVKNPFYKHLNFLPQVKFSYELSPKGVVSQLSGIESLTKHTDGNMSVINLLRHFGKQEIITEMYNYIPVKPIKLNDTWKIQALLPELMNLKYDVNYKLKETTPKNLKLELNSKFNFTKEDSIPGKNRIMKLEETGIQNGILQIDHATGLRTSSSVEQKVDMILKSKNTKTSEEQTDPAKIITRLSFNLLK